MLNNILGANIRNNRIANNWTQEKLADMLCVTSQAISRWENGTATPDISMLCSLSGIFGVTLDDLCGLSVESVHNSIIEIEDAITKDEVCYSSLISLWNKTEQQLSLSPVNDNLLHAALLLLRKIHDLIETDKQKEVVNSDICKISERILDFSRNDTYRSFANYNLALYYAELIVLNRCSEEDLRNAELAKKYADLVLYQDMHKTFYYTFGATTTYEISKSKERTLIELLEMSKRACQNCIRIDDAKSSEYLEVFQMIKQVLLKIVQN